jgi:hypothetical protein
MFSATVGVADTVGPSINSRATDGSAGFTSGPFATSWNGVYNAIANQLNAINGGNLTGAQVANSIAGSNPYAESYKTYMGSAALTAPDSAGALAGSTLYGGIVNGFNNSVLGSGAGNPTTSYYVGATVATPIDNLRTGVAFDYLNSHANKNFGGNGLVADLNSYSVALYASYQATEKLSFHARGEYFDTVTEENLNGISGSSKVKIWSLTGTAQYDLWRNVISRVELRWDHGDNGAFFGGTVPGQPDARNAWMLAGNVIYKF